MKYRCGKCGEIEHDPIDDPLLALAIAEGRAYCRACIAGKVPEGTPTIRQHVGTTFDGYELGESGALWSKHTCGACGQRYTLCPAVPSDDCCGAPPGLRGPNDPGCATYDARRDVDRMLGDGTAVLFPVPERERGQA